MNNRGAFTFIEVLITVAIIAVLSGVVLVSINPGEFLAKGRDTQRKGHLVTILNSVGQIIYQYLKPQPNNLIVDLSKFSKGEYFVKFYYNNTNYTNKIILE